MSYGAKKGRQLTNEDAGHSLGGAIGALFAMDMATRANISMKLYTFGGPRYVSGSPGCNTHYQEGSVALPHVSPQGGR